MQKNHHKFVSRAVALHNLKQTFKKSSQDKLLISEIVSNWGREDKKAENNRKWVGTKIMQFEDHGFIERIYVYPEGRKILQGVRLTDEGKAALEGNLSFKEESRVEHSEKEGDQTTLDEIMNILERYKKANPQYDIAITIKLKTE